MPHESLLRVFDAHSAALNQVAQRLERELEGHLRAAGVPVHFVASRVKSRDSLARKLARPEKTYRALWDVTDLIGLRVATYFEDVVDDVARLIEARFQVDFRHSTDKLRFSDAGRFGYRSLHYVCALPDVEGLAPGFRFEIQVRTALQHAWAQVEHDLGYKASAAVPDAIRRRFSRVASLLEIADQEFVAIRRELAAYHATVKDALAHPERPLPLDALALEEVVADERVEVLDAGVAGTLGLPRSHEAFFPDYLVTLLRACGLSDTRALFDAISRHGAAAVRLVEPYFAVARTELDLDSAKVGAVKRGYGLFFLAHAALLRAPELGLSKVGRLTRVYQQLDYPEDEAAAHHLASALVHALQPVAAG
ncbi:MAG: GTP pyrophosphokinase family protein [Myxococcota bacterium]